MNVDYFRESLELVSYCGGVLLNAEKIALIENSLTILQSENKFQNIFFWGRITGIANDYYIAFGYLKDCLRGRRFFFSTDCAEWYLLPSANPEQYGTCLLASHWFHGDISVIDEVSMDPKFIIQPGDNIIPAKQETRFLKEEDRLSCVVTMITEETALLPRMALTKRIDGKVVYNPTFRGLAQTAAMKIDNFQLYRTPMEKWNSNLLKRPDYNYSTDIFDTIDTIIPDGGSFSHYIEPERGLVLLKSLHWPGMVFFHKCRSRKHGFCYFGDGKKNADILFML